MPDHIEFLTLEISEDSSNPKYRQIAESITRRIETGQIRYGQKLPSINQLSTLYLLSRDTVEKAYRLLREKNIITSRRGMGYYVTNSFPESRYRILVLFNKLSAYKKEIYNELAYHLRDRAVFDFFVYHCDFRLFNQILTEHKEGYHYYVIMPHFSEYSSSALTKSIGAISPEKLIIMDQKIPGVDNFFGCVYQDFKEDIYQALEKAREHISKYEKLILVFPDNHTYPYPKEIISGFTKFCRFNQLNFEIINSVTLDYQLKRSTAFVLISENDLANVIKLSKNLNYILGTDLGILSYNDTVLKEVLETGITVMTTDFKQMGKMTARMILENKPIVYKNDFNLILRNSL